MDRFVIRLKSKSNDNNEDLDMRASKSTLSDSQATPLPISERSDDEKQSTETDIGSRFCKEVSQQSEPEQSKPLSSQECDKRKRMRKQSSATEDSEEEEEDIMQVKKKRRYHNISVSKISKEFKWVDEQKDYLFCKICNVKLSGSRFHLKRHEKNLNHKKGVKGVKISKSLDSLMKIHDNTSLNQQIKIAEIKLCCFICEENLPLLLMDKLPVFCGEIFHDSKIAQGVVIKRGKATKLITGVLGPSFRKEVIGELKTSKFSIIIDETTDVSTKKSLVVVARYWSEEHQRVLDRFIDLVEVENCTAEALFTILKNFLNENNISYNNLIGFASDNASVMMGSISGVQARMKDIAPHIYIQGCSCHSLHLCASAAASKLPNNVEQFVRDIYSYFSHSSKRLSELRECQIFAQEKPHRLLYPSQTRWLSLKAVVDRTLEHWNSLRLFFQRAALEDNLPNAKTILNALENDIYKVYLLFLSYTLELITKLNIELQSENPKAPILISRMTALYKTFLRSFIKKSILDTKNFADIIIINNPAIYKGLDDMYFGAKLDAFLSTDNLKCSKDDIKNFKLRALEYYIEICNQIKKRFNFKDKHLELASNFAPSIAVSGNIMSLANFVNLFPNIEIDIESANAEWQVLPDNMMLSENVNINEFWKKVDNFKTNDESPMFSNLMKIAKVILALPHSSATAERVFSQLALIKTFLRNRLLITTVASILHIKDRMKYTQDGAKGYQPNIRILNYNSKTLENIQVD